VPWAWQFPLILAGTGSGPGVVPGAILSMTLYLTVFSVFSVFAGLEAVGAVGAGAGYLVRERSAGVAVPAGSVVATLAGLIAALASAVLVG